MADQYRLEKKIGGGSFGEIYSSVDTVSGSRCAVKMERVDKKPQRLMYEYRVYSLLLNEVGFPRIYHYGTEGEYNCMVMQLLGPSLDDILQKRGTLSVVSVCLIADQLLQRFGL